MATNIGIWPGSGSAVSGSTPFGTWDDDADFQNDAPKVADWVCRRLGYDIMTVELKDTQIYACFEEAVAEYSTQINNSNMANWLLNYLGESTSSAITGKNPLNTQDFQKRYSSFVSTDAGAGGEIDWKTGSIQITSNQQEYDIQALWGAASESNARLIIREIWHYPRAAMQYGATGGEQAWMDSNFGADFGRIGGSAQAYFLQPMYQDVLRAQAIELSDTFRKSQYSFEVINNKLRITPVPTANTKLYFRYTLKTNPVNSDDTSADSPNTGISDQSNIPYNFITYSNINSMGKQWIRDYTLALCKELLGHIRSKFGSVPIPDGEVTLDGESLISEGREDKQTLLEKLDELLEKTSISALIEAEKEAQANLQEQYNKTPLLVYVG